jgi:hypothetical protein
VASLETLQEKMKRLMEKDLLAKERLSFFPSTIIFPVPYRDILKEVSQNLPDNITLKLLAVRQKEKTSKEESQPTEGKEFHISGLAFGSDENCLTALALIIERLERSPLFNNVKLVSSDENKLYNRPGTGFEITCDINLNNPSSHKKGGG